MKLKEIEIQHRNDEDPDLSYYGKFSNNPVGSYPDDITISHDVRGEYKYFHASNCENVEQAKQNYQRMLGYGTDWVCVGVCAVATVVMGDTVQTISTAGLWGIESDCGESEIKDVGLDEIYQLKKMLDDCGPVDSTTFDNLAKDAVDQMS